MELVLLPDVGAGVEGDGRCAAAGRLPGLLLMCRGRGGDGRGGKRQGGGLGKLHLGLHNTDGLQVKSCCEEFLLPSVGGRVAGLYTGMAPPASSPGA